MRHFTRIALSIGICSPLDSFGSMLLIGAAT